MHRKKPQRETLRGFCVPVYSIAMVLWLSSFFTSAFGTLSFRMPSSYLAVSMKMLRKTQSNDSDEA